MNNNHQSTWEQYVASWKADTPSEVQTIFANCLAPSCQYNDPLATTKGQEELIAYMTNLHQQVPGVHFVTNHFQAFNNRSIATWEMRMGDNTPLTSGISYGEYNQDGKLISMSSFYELPQA